MNALARRLATIALVLGTSLPAAASDLWIHVDVRESGNDPSTVKINLPFALVQAAAPLIEERKLRDPDIYWNGDRVDVEEMRGLWSRLRAGEAKVERNGSTFALVGAGPSQALQIRTPDGVKNSVITIPVIVVDALLSQPGGDVDVKAAVAALAKCGDGELLAVDDTGTRARIWIDRFPEQR